MGLTIEKRIMVTPSTKAAPYLLELARLTGKAPSRLIRELLDETMPNMAPVIEALKVIKTRSDLVRGALSEMVMSAENSLKEVQLGLDLEMQKKPGRKPAKVRSR